MIQVIPNFIYCFNVLPFCTYRIFLKTGNRVSEENNPSNPNTYIAEDNMHEVARLVRQSHRFTKEAGYLPAKDQWKNIRSVLDIGCGPGGWLLDIASEHSDITATGVDNNSRMIATAINLAKAEHVSNVKILQMDAKHLELPDASFDLIHGRLMNSFLDKKTWPVLVQECYRLLSPGGILLLIDLEAIVTNSPALEAAAKRLYQIHFRAGRSFSQGGSIGITFMFPNFLKSAGFKHIQNKGIVLDASHGSEGFPDWREDFIVMNSTFRPYEIRLGIATEQELDRSLEEILHDMDQDDFSALALNVCVSGIKL